MTDTTSISRFVCGYPEIARIVTAVLEMAPGHERVLHRNLASHSEQDLHSIEIMAGQVGRLLGDRFGQAIASYLWMVDIFKKEELQFRRTRRYSCSSINEAQVRYYSDNYFMGRYMDGLLISQVIWYNHARSWIFFINEFMPRLAAGYNYLEIGPGHGLFLAQAARDARCQSAVGWDVSLESLAQTKEALVRLGGWERVSLAQQDVMVVRDHHASGTFDVAVISEVLEHLENPGAALVGLRSALKPSGLLFVNVPANSPAPDHIYLLSHPDAATEMVEAAGYHVEQVRHEPVGGYTLEQAIKNKITVNCLIIARPGTPR